MLSLSQSAVRPLARCAQPRASVLSSWRRNLSGLKINADRLHETLHQTCQWGAAHPYGR
jgi:hypothetical protein